MSAWKGGCSAGDDALLPGVSTWQCTLFDAKRKPSCIDQVFVYRLGPARDPAAGGRWEMIEGAAPVTCL